MEHFKQKVADYCSGSTCPHHSAPMILSSWSHLAAARLLGESLSSALPAPPAALSEPDTCHCIGKISVLDTFSS